MATIQELERALVNADRAGDTDAARKLAAVIIRARQDASNLIPGTPVLEAVAQPEKPTIGERVVGTGEAALSMATGATGGTIGMIGGTLKGLAEQILSGNFGTQEAVKLVEQEAMKGAQALTYAPRTQQGQEIAKAGGELIAQVLPPVLPMIAAPGAVQQAAQQAKTAARVAATPVVQAVKETAQTAAGKLKQAITPSAPSGATPGTPGSAGSMGVDIATQRAMKAEELPIPIKLTEGQKTRQFEDVRFERETAKLPEVGEPLRERFAQQNQQLRQNLDAFIDMTGAQAGESNFRRATGVAVNEALRSRAARDKAKIRVLYKEAERAGELENPVNLSPIADYLNRNRAGRSSAPIMSTLAEEFKVQGIGTGSLADGTLQTGPVTLKQAESLRRSINRFVKDNDPNDVRIASELKQLIDSQTEGLGGNLYKQARAARARYAADYENIALVKNLLGVKRGTTDRAIALEEVLNRSIIDPGTSLDTIRQMRKLLQTEGDNGMQAWRELQGGTLQYIKEEALRNVAPDQFGNRIVSPAQLDRVITNLDKSGKLQFVFGKKGAEQLRTINDVAKDVLTVPPGTVNTSNTASVLAGLMDVAISGTSGVPAPVMTGFRLLRNSIKDKKIRARVRQALGE
jgi:hypothetical protein